MDEIERKFPSIAFDFTFDSPEFFNRAWLIIKKKSADQTALTFDSPTEEGELMLMNEVLNCIVENKLPIIVHNGFLDMMHVIFAIKIDFLEIFLKITSFMAIILSKTSSNIPLSL